MFKEVLEAFKKIDSKTTFQPPLLENVDMAQIRYICPSVIGDGLVVRDDSYIKHTEFRNCDFKFLLKEVKKEIEAITDEHGQRYVLSKVDHDEYVILDLSKVDRIGSYYRKHGVLLLNAKGQEVDSVKEGYFEDHLRSIEPVLNKRRRQAAKHVSPSVVEKPTKVLIAGHVIDLADVVSFRPWLMSKGIVVEGHKTNILKNTVCDYEVESKKLEAALNKYLGY